MSDLVLFYMLIAAAFLQPLVLLVTRNIDKRQYFGIVQIYMFVLLVAYMVDRA